MGEMKGKDRLSKERRSWNMSRIKGKNTKPEMVVRSLLHQAGYRFRLHDKKLPGKPDIVLPKYKTVIFVHGCFWHQHEGCPKSSRPSGNATFWVKKLKGNVQRDKHIQSALCDLGWRVIVIWTCELKSEKARLRILSALEQEPSPRRLFRKV